MLLQVYNSFGIVVRVHYLVRVRSEVDLLVLRALFEWVVLTCELMLFVLGGGSNLVIMGDVKLLVFKVEIMGWCLVEENDKGWLIEVGVGENWYIFV